MAAVGAPYDYGKISNVISFILLCISVLAVGTRVATKWSMARRLQGDDIFAILALVLCSAQTVALAEAVSNGLGQHLSSLSASQLQSFQRSTYAASLLHVVTLALSKISILLLVRQLTPIKLYKNLTLCIGITICIWGVTAFFAIAFECPIPQTWQVIGNKCLVFPAFWNYFGASNIISDVALIVLPTVVLWNVHISNERKAAICCCFGARIVVVIATSLQMAYAQSLFVSEDFTFSVWQQALCTQFVQNLSVITACIPYLKPFYLGLSSGLLWNAGGSAPQTPENASKANRTVASIRHKPQRSRSSVYAGKHSATESNYITTIEGGNHIVLGKWDEESHHSQSRIIQTTTWAIGSESAEPAAKTSEDGESTST